MKISMRLTRKQRRGCTSAFFWWYCWTLLACSALASQGSLQPDDSIVGDSGASVVAASHLTSSHPDEEDRILHTMDANHDTVVSHSELLQAISKNIVLDAARTPASLPPGRTTARFFLSLRSAYVGGMPSKVQEVRVVALEPAVATASFGVSPLTTHRGQRKVNNGGEHQRVGGFLQEVFSQNLAAELRVKCACHAPGKARFHVTVALEGEAALGESFVFDKSCRGDQLHGFDVGTAPLQKDVVDDGASRWPASHVPVIPFDRPFLSLYVSPRHMSSSSLNAKGVYFQPPIVRVWDIQDLQHTAIDGTARSESDLRSHYEMSMSTLSGSKNGTMFEAQVSSVLGSGDGKLKFDQPTEVTVAFKCLKPSTALIELMLLPRLVWDPFQPVSIFLKKECFGGFKQGFNVGTARGGADIVHDGIVQSRIADVGSNDVFSQLFVDYSSASPSDVDQHVRPFLRCSDEHHAGTTPVAVAHLSVQHGGAAYNISYKCNRPGVSLCTMSLGLTFWKSVDLHWRKRCGSTSADFIVESSFAESAAVFGGGEASTMWAPANPTMSLAPDNNVAVFTVRPSQAAVKGVGARTLSLLSPRVHVSDASVLDVIVAKEGQEGPAPLVFIARHVCKQRGSAQVNIMIPRSFASGAFIGKKGPFRSGLDAHELDQDPLDQVAFAYRKICSMPAGSGGLSFLGMRTFLSVQTLSRWDVPTGGWRVLLVAFVVLLLGVVLFEFGHRYMSSRMMREITQHMGPEMFGIDFEVGSLSIRPWTGVFIMRDFVMKNPPGYKGEYLLKAAEVTVLIDSKRILWTRGHVFDITLLRLQHMDVRVEFSGFLPGSSNIALVRDNVWRSLESYNAQDAELVKQGKKPNFFMKMISARSHDMLDHATLHRAEFLDIYATAHHPLLGGEVGINDMHFADFSADRDAVGVRTIAYALADAFHNAIQQDALGATGAKVANIGGTEGPASPKASEAQ